MPEHLQAPNDWSNVCHAYDSRYGVAYGYLPSLAAGIVFCIFFATSMVVHAVQAVVIKVPGTEKGSGRQWWTLVFAVGALTELIGWAGRLWNAKCPYMGTPFLMQISTLIIAPAFFTAGIYIILGRMIQRLGPSMSLLSARAYLWIFCTCDVVSLVVQAIGGGMASVAFNSVPQGNTKLGTNIMVAGIVFQMASIAVFTAFYVDFIRRCGRGNGLNGGMRWLVAASAFSVALIFARSVYRTIELLQGWNGYLITREAYFIGLDGALMAGSVITFNFAHPGWLLRGTTHQDLSGEKMFESRDGVVPTEGSEHDDASVKPLSSGDLTPNMRNDEHGVACSSQNEPVGTTEQPATRRGLRGIFSKKDREGRSDPARVETS